MYFHTGCPPWRSYVRLDLFHVFLHVFWEFKIVLRGFRGLIDVWSSRCSQLVLSTCLLGVIWDMLAFEKVAVLRILLHRRNLGGGIPVSASSAEVDVVLKHP